MRQGLFVLLCISVWINYIDRGNLSIAAAGGLRRELNLDQEQMGILLSGFFWTYALMQPVAGWLVTRFNVYYVYAVGYAVWSVAVALGGMADGFLMLMLTRLMLGIGESVAYPAYSQLLTRGFAEERRGMANAMIDIGSKAGPALGTWLGGMVIVAWDWRTLFLWTGVLSLIWLLPWLQMSPRRLEAVATKDQGDWKEVIALPAAWVTFFGLFCFNYAFYFLLTWLPSWLTEEKHFSPRDMAIYAALPYCATAIASLAGAYWADRRISEGASARVVRRRMATVGLLLCGSMLLASVLASTQVAMVCLVLAFVGIGLFTCNAWAISQTLAGPQRAGVWTGLQNAVANMAGVLAPWLTGRSIKVTGTYLTAFFIAAAMLAVGAFLYGVLLPRARSTSAESRNETAGEHVI
jgi:MFS transporter, ACS family, D-galactonate transporter